MQNPYKVEPIVATRIPAGSTYTRPVIVYNPRDAPTLAITEVRGEGEGGRNQMAGQDNMAWGRGSGVEG